MFRFLALVLMVWSTALAGGSGSKPLLPAQTQDVMKAVISKPMPIPWEDVSFSKIASYKPTKIIVSNDGKVNIVYKGKLYNPFSKDCNAFALNIKDGLFFVYCQKFTGVSSYIVDMNSSYIYKSGSLVASYIDSRLILVNNMGRAYSPKLVLEGFGVPEFTILNLKENTMRNIEFQGIGTKEMKIANGLKACSEVTYGGPLYPSKLQRSNDLIVLTSNFTEYSPLNQPSTENITPCPIKFEFNPITLRGGFKW